ncbi:hypothetical protein [Bremerella cremea]|uniref:hypothetical protein n=1 Tax=Bremerella cremea TaxID=1031537 RepID=UPI0031F0B9D3
MPAHRSAQTLVFALALGVATTALAAEPTEQMRRWGQLFRPASVPSIVGKGWIEFETGPDDYGLTHRGWRMDDDAEQLQILTWEGELQRFRKPKPGVTRPEVEKVERDPNGKIVSLKIRHDQDPGFMTAWDIEECDFTEMCEHQLKGWPPAIDVSFLNRADQFAYDKKDAIRSLVDSAKYAAYAFDLGEIEVANQLHKLARDQHKAYIEKYREAEQDLDQFLVEHQARELRTSAIRRGCAGISRGELLALWQQILSLPKNKLQPEADQMATSYQRLIEEDIDWEEPRGDEIESMPVDQQVAYWMHHLRDHNARQQTEPGMCNVLLVPTVPEGETAPPNPADELRKLGTAAIPVLIEHMDDTRPTRCFGYWRIASDDDIHLLTYGDCCVQIFEAIANKRIYRRKTTTSYPSTDGQAADCKAKAAAWWQEQQP